MPLYSADIFGIIKNEYALYRENQDKQFISNLYSTELTIEDLDIIGKEAYNFFLSRDKVDKLWSHALTPEINLSGIQSERDLQFRDYIFNKNKYLDNEIKVIDCISCPEWVQIFELVQETMAKRPESGVKNMMFFTSEGKGRQHRFLCSKCGFNAKTILELKYQHLPKHAREKQHKFDWLNELSYTERRFDNFSIRPKFDPYDYWFYEQITCVNQCVECSAYIDKIFTEEKALRSHKDQILHLIKKCIAENYSYIMNFCDIDWKIMSLKGAIKLVVDYYRGSEDSSYSKYFVKKRMKYLNTENTGQKQKIFEYLISQEFNHILWLFYLENYTRCNELSLKPRLESFVTPNDLGSTEFKGIPDITFRGMCQEQCEESSNKMVSIEMQAQVKKQLISELLAIQEEDIQLYLNITGNAYSALVFSDLKNDYVKKCIESGEKSATKQLFSAIHKAMSSSRKNQKNSEVFNNISMG